MSVRAYRVNKLEWENRATFNLWHDKEIIEWLENNTSFYDGLNSDCSSGITELSISDIERVNYLVINYRACNCEHLRYDWLVDNQPSQKGYTSVRDFGMRSNRHPIGDHKNGREI